MTDEGGPTFFANPKSPTTLETSGEAESGMRPALAPYRALIEAFVEGRLRPTEFETIYLELFKNDPTMWLQDLFDILDRLFGDVDAYCSDPSLRDADDLDEEQLKRSAQRALDELRKQPRTDSGKYVGTR